MAVKMASQRTVDIKCSECLQVIYMLILIMLLFFLCSSPILTFNFLASFELLGADNIGTSTNTKNIKTAFSLLSYSNR